MKILYITILLYNQMCHRMNEISKISGDSFQVSIMALETMSKSKCINIETLYIYDPEQVAVSPHVINDNIISREESYRKELLHLKKFKKLKHLYFLNIHMTDIPEEILCLNKLEELQFNFLNHFIPEKQISKLIKLKNLKILIINGDFIGEENFDVIKNRLSKMKIEVSRS